MHEVDLSAFMTQSGFPLGAYFETLMQAKVDRNLFPAPSGTGQDSQGSQEDYGRTPQWTAFGAIKPSAQVLP